MRNATAALGVAVCVLLMACESDPVTVEVGPDFSVEEIPPCIHVSPSEGVEFVCGEGEPEGEVPPPAVYVDGENITQSP